MKEISGLINQGSSSSTKVLIYSDGFGGDIVITGSCQIRQFLLVVPDPTLSVSRGMERLVSM
jgi:hypothetical protein